jgi:hypothetical protein
MVTSSFLPENWYRGWLLLYIETKFYHSIYNKLFREYSSFYYCFFCGQDSLGSVSKSGAFFSMAWFFRQLKGIQTIYRTTKLNSNKPVCNRGITSKNHSKDVKICSFGLFMTRLGAEINLSAPQLLELTFVIRKKLTGTLKKWCSQVKLTLESSWFATSYHMGPYLKILPAWQEELGSLTQAFRSVYGSWRVNAAYEGPPWASVSKEGNSDWRLIARPYDI